jgi:redox-sensitive bicupin YhaK (pirin superfamily)
MSIYRTVQRVIDAPLASDGEGVVIHRAFPNHELNELDPFLLLDHMGPVDLKPGEAKGFPDHPHRGFETVTYLLAGEFEHRDSFGHHGVLRPGVVQWMTAGSGLVHSEVPGASLVKNGGKLEGFQLWVNLPRKDKMKAPRYQEFSASQIPVARSADGTVEVKVIAGAAMGVKGAVETHIPIEYLHFKLQPGARHVQEVATGLNAMIYVISGWLLVGGTSVPAFHLASLTVDKDAVEFWTDGPTEFLLVAAKPIHEPVARYGPFVMNTEAELHQAFADYKAGRMGSISVRE